jgi:ribosomal protein L37AE/L43A
MEILYISLFLISICTTIIFFPDIKKFKRKKNKKQIKYYVCEKCDWKLEFLDNVWKCSNCGNFEKDPKTQVTERDGLRYYKFKGEDE